MTLFLERNGSPTHRFGLPKWTLSIINLITVHPAKHRAVTMVNLRQQFINLSHHSTCMAEEHRCQAPEGHRLCTNNCGFIGSPTTMNLCSKCYRDIRLKLQEEASTKSTIETALSSTTSSPPSPAVVSISRVSNSTVTLTKDAIPSGLKSEAVQPNRCGSCKKRVGLTGFKCRCGVTFCGTHRYPEKHVCSFDFKTVGREEIAKANPVIKATKLERI